MRAARTRVLRTVDLGRTELGTLRTCARVPRAPKKKSTNPPTILFQLPRERVFQIQIQNQIQSYPCTPFLFLFWPIFLNIVVKAGGLFCQISCTGCRSKRKKHFKRTCLNRIPVLWHRGYRYSGTFSSTLYTHQLVL